MVCICLYACVFILDNISNRIENWKKSIEYDFVYFFVRTVIIYLCLCTNYVCWKWCCYCWCYLYCYLALLLLVLLSLLIFFCIHWMLTYVSAMAYYTHLWIVYLLCPIHSRCSNLFSRAFQFISILYLFILLFSLLNSITSSDYLFIFPCFLPLWLLRCVYLCVWWNGVYSM